MPDVIPIYIFVSSTLVVVISALYTRFSVRHFPLRGHSFGNRQLQFVGDYIYVYIVYSSQKSYHLVIVKNLNFSYIISHLLNIINISSISNWFTHFFCGQVNRKINCCATIINAM